METAKQQYDEFMGGDIEENPLDRLRYFCSIAMSNQDWIDAEPFFNDIEDEIEKLRSDK